MIRQDILDKFPDLFGTKKVNGREVDVYQTIATLTRELDPEIATALNARRALLASPAPVGTKYAWPGWHDTFEDPVSGQPWTFRQIVQGLIDNFLGRDTQWRWRLNDETPIPEHVHPSRNPGLELTGPWHPLDMAFNALNSPAPMNMPDFEDASPPHFQPDGTPSNEPVGIFAAMQNAKEIHEGRWTGRPYEVVKKGKKRSYKIDRPPAQWPTRLARPPSIHVRYDHVTVDGVPAPGLVVITTLWLFNNHDALTRAGSGVYFYIPKLQTPREALIVEKLLSRLEGIIGVPPGTIKVKMLYEEGNAGRYLPAIAWVLRRRLLGTNVGRWDYLGSIIEMWKDDPKGIFADPQTVGMATPNMIAYQRYNALMMLMAGMKDGELSHASPIGGMAAVMIYQAADPYGRSRYNPLALRAIVVDKLRERLLGLIFVPDAPLPAGAPPTLRGHPRRQGEGPALRRIPAELGREPRARVRRRRQRPAAGPARAAPGDPRRAAPDGGGEGKAGLDRRERSRRRGAIDAPVARRPRRRGEDHALRRDARVARHAGEAPLAGAVGRHLRRAQGRRHHRARPALLLHGGELRLPDPERQLRRGHRRLRAEAALHERPRHVPHLRLVALDPRAPPGRHHQGRPPAAAGAHRGRRGARRERRAGEGRARASPRSSSRRSGTIHDEWTNGLLRGAGPARRARPLRPRPRRR